MPLISVASLKTFHVTICGFLEPRHPITSRLCRHCCHSLLHGRTATDTQASQVADEFLTAWNCQEGQHTHPAKQTPGAAQKRRVKRVLVCQERLSVLLHLKPHSGRRGITWPLTTQPHGRCSIGQIMLGAPLMRPYALPQQATKATARNPPTVTRHSSVSGHAGGTVASWHTDKNSALGGVHFFAARVLAAAVAWPLFGARE